MKAKTREAQKKPPGHEHPGSRGTTKTRSRNPGFRASGDDQSGEPLKGTLTDWSIRGADRGPALEHAGIGESGEAQEGGEGSGSKDGGGGPQSNRGGRWPQSGPPGRG